MPSGRPLVPLEVSEETRKQLESIAQSPNIDSDLSRRAEIVLLAAEGWPNEAVAGALGSSQATVGKWRQRFVEGG